MSNRNGYAINPELEDDVESVMSDDEASNISLSQIELPSSDPPLVEAVETRSSESSEITLSSLSFPSTEHSSAEETCIKKQDVLQISEVSQKDVLKKETEKDVLDKVSEDAINPAGYTEKTVSEASSTPKKRKLEESPNRKTGFESKDISGETSEYKFKKIKQEDISIEMPSTASYSSNVSSESKSLEDKVLPSAFVEDSLKEHKGTQTVEDISTDIREENIKLGEEDSNLENIKSTSVEKAELSDSSKVRKTEKRKLSSLESPDSNIKIQKLASKSEGSLEDDTVKNVDDTKSLENPIIELNVPDSKQSEGVIQASDESDLNIKKASKDICDTNVPESCEMSDNSQGTTSVTGSVSSSDDHVNIELSKLSPAVLDEDAMLSTPEKSEKFFKSQTPGQSKEKIQLQDVKLSITACMRKINLESRENIDKYAESSKKILSNTLDSENKSADTDNSALRQESESDSVLSNDQELIGKPIETSVETLEQQMIKKCRESPALIDEDAMIIPPDTLQAAKEESHNLDAPTSSKVETSLIPEEKNDENFDFSCIKKSLNIDEVKSEISVNPSEYIESSSKEISISSENITEKSLEESFINPTELTVTEDTNSSTKSDEYCMLESKLVSKTSELSEISSQNLPKFSKMSSEKSSRKLHKSSQTTSELYHVEDTSNIEKSSPLSEVSRKDLSDSSRLCTAQSDKLSELCKDIHEPSSSENPRKTDLPGTSQELEDNEESQDNSETCSNIEKDVISVTIKLFENVLESEEKEITPVQLSSPDKEKNRITELSESLEQDILEVHNSDTEQEQKDSLEEFTKND